MLDFILNNIIDQQEFLNQMLDFTLNNIIDQTRVPKSNVGLYIE